MKPVASSGGIASTSNDNGSKSRLAKSLTCRRWYYWRQQEREFGTKPPVWVLTSPPWPVLRLAFKLAGKPVYLAAVQMVFGLLASNSDEMGEIDSREQVGDLPSDDDDHSFRGRFLAVSSWFSANRRFRANVY